MTQIRTATARDSQAISHVLCRSISEACWEDHRGDAGVLKAWLANKTEDNIAKWVQAQDALAIVATRETDVVGFALSKAEDLQLLYVLPEFMRQGVGGNLLGFVENHLLTAGASTLRLDSTVTALPFYARRGFKIAGEPHAWAGMKSQPMVKRLAPDPSFQRTACGGG